MKGKFTSVILAVVLVAITAGTIFFGYSKASGKITKSGAEEEQRYAWPLATCSTEDTITHIFATQFAKEVEKLSDGKMKINVYPQSTLGGDRELMESCKDGDIPFVVQSPAPQVSFMPQLVYLIHHVYLKILMMPEKQSIIQISRKKFRKFIKVQAMIYLESQTSVFV